MTDVTPGIYDNRHTMRREYWRADSDGIVRPVAALSAAMLAVPNPFSDASAPAWGRYPNIPNSARRRKWPRRDADRGQ